MYRMLAAFSSTVDDAIRWVGVFLNIMFIYAGYIIPRNQLLGEVPWFGWISYINPVAFGFEALLTNEYDGVTMTCSEANLVPRGSGSEAGYQGYSLPGSEAGSTIVDGAAYLKTAFNFVQSNLWRNFAIIFAFTVFFLVVNVVVIDRTRFAESSAQSTIFAKQPTTKRRTDRAKLEEKQILGKTGQDDSIFTFKDICCTIPYQGHQRRLLNSISGYAKSGKMIALMGSSGAGKTALLNTLAQRQRVSVVSGDMLVNGSVLSDDFQRSAGFCEQQDIHEGSSTIREALEFSALLRQEREVPVSEKVAYVDWIMQLLELDDIEHAMISSLTVEQRKRVTIGVELAAKPSLLLFLDEPTSGLDSQSAYSIIRFLRRLCNSGLAIICTIHQPSSDLIEQFDMILAVNPGGNTFYFGPVGEDGSVVVDYFAARGFRCPPHQNVAEFILETASHPCINEHGVEIDWNEEWRNSTEAKAILDEIDIATAETKTSTVSSRKPNKFAAPVWRQSWLLTKRMFIKYWREPSYVYSRLFLHVIIGIFNGFTFWDQANTVASLQNRMFTNLTLAFFVSPAVVNSSVANFFSLRDLWEDRELPSCTYGWVAFCTANVVTEIPISIVAATVYWLPSYFAVGFPSAAPVAGYVYLMTIMWSIFAASWGQWIAASGPTYEVVGNIIPFFLVVVALFNGMFAPYSTFPAFWKYWMYYINPLTWYCRGVLSSTMPEIPVHCADAEFARFEPPPGQTCSEYAAQFLQEIAGGGYLQNADAMSDCGYCHYSNGAEYMATLNVQVGDNWPCLGYMVAFTLSNWFLVYFFVYTTRIKGWTFGFGLVAKSLEKLRGKMLPKKSVDNSQDKA